MIARVREVTFRAASAADRLRSSGPPISTKTGRAPVYRMALAVATKVRAGHRTSSPGPSPKAAQARCRAAVPLATARAWGTPRKPGPGLLKFLCPGAHGEPARFQDGASPRQFLPPQGRHPLTARASRSWVNRGEYPLAPAAGERAGVRGRLLKQHSFPAYSAPGGPG